MKRFALLAAFALFLTAVPASAQVSVYGGGGPAFTTGDFDDVDSGISLFGGVVFDLSDRLSLYGEGGWGKHELGSVDVNPSHLMGGVLLGLSGNEDASVSPYIFAGGGAQTLGVGDNDETEFGLQAGLGFGFDLAGLGAFAEGRYQRADFGEDGADSVFQLFTIALGLSFDIIE